MYKTYVLKCRNPYTIFMIDKFIHEKYGNDAVTWYEIKPDYEKCWFKIKHKKESSIGVVVRQGKLTKNAIYVHYFDDKETQILNFHNNIVEIYSIKDFLLKTDMLYNNTL